MKNTLLILGAALALGTGFAEEPKTEQANAQTEVLKSENQSALDELKTQKEVLAQMREGLSDEDRKALEEDFKSKLAEIDQRISQLEAIDQESAQ